MRRFYNRAFVLMTLLVSTAGAAHATSTGIRFSSYSDGSPALGGDNVLISRETEPGVFQNYQIDVSDIGSYALSHITGKDQQVAYDSGGELITGSPSVVRGLLGLAPVAASGAYSDLAGAPSLATVATSGSYTDLLNKPTLGTMAAQSAALYTPTASLAAVALSGAYSSLSGLPTIPATTSQLTNNSGFITSAGAPVQSVNGQTGTVSLTIPAAQVNSDWNAGSGLAQILNKPSLATVATSGAYSDLSGKPTIPAAQVNSDWAAASGISQILNKPTLGTLAALSYVSDGLFAGTLSISHGGIGLSAAPASGQLLLGNGSGYAVQSISGDAALAASGALTVSKTGGVAFSSSATIDATNASNIASGTLSSARLPALTGDVTTSAGSAATSLAATGVTAGSYRSANITVDTKGRISSAATGFPVYLNNGSTTPAGDFQIGQTGTGGTVRFSSANGFNGYMGLYDNGNGVFYGISQYLPSPSGTSTLGGYYKGLGVGGSATGTSDPIFGVLNSSESGNGIGSTAFTILANNTVYTFHNVLDDGNGNMNVSGRLTANNNSTINGTGSTYALLVTGSGSEGSIMAEGKVNEGATDKGIQLGYGPAGDSPRFVLSNGTAAQNLEIDNYGGTMRFFIAYASPLLTLNGSSNAVTTSHNTLDNGSGAMTASATIKTGGYTVSMLPTGTIGMRAYVTDQTTACPAIGAALTGGGSVICPVFYNGSAWVSG